MPRPVVVLALGIAAALILLVPFFACGAPLPAKALAVAKGQIGIVEKTGRNDGPEVKKYLQAVGLPEGNPYCAAFVVWTYRTAAAPAASPVPRIARVSLLWSTAKASPRFETFSRSQIIAGIWKQRAGDIFVMLFGQGPNPNGHTGLCAEPSRPSQTPTVEANTQPADAGDQREGGGVYARTRRPSQMAGIIRVRGT